MSKSPIAPSYKKDSGGRSGNEGRLHRGMKHDGYFSPERLERLRRIRGEPAPEEAGGGE